MRRQKKRPSAKKCRYAFLDDRMRIRNLEFALERTEEALQEIRNTLDWNRKLAVDGIEMLEGISLLLRAAKNGDRLRDVVKYLPAIT